MKKLFFVRLGGSFQPLTTALVAISLVLLSGCEKPSLHPEAASPAASPTTEEVKGENPFSVDIMRQAYTNLLAKQGTNQPQGLQGATTSSAGTSGPGAGANAAAAIQPTHQYLRFKPADINQLADLGDLGFNLSWEPMDESVAAATTVNYQSEEIPWIYSVVPVGTTIPTHIQSQQISQLYLYNEEDGDKQDNPDPWQPPTCQEWDPSCRCYIPCATEVYKPKNPGVDFDKTLTVPSKLSNQAVATANLKKAGIAPRDLTAEAMRLSGHADEIMPAAGQTTSGTYSTQLFGGRYHPKGKIQVQDTELGIVPLRGVEVKSRRWFQFGGTFTDDQGNFAISTSYSSLAKLSLNFKNGLATTRGLVQGLQLWSAVLPISAEIGAYSRDDMEKVNYTVSYISGPANTKSKGASTWSAATLFNTLAETRDIAWSLNIPAPTRSINVWLLPDFPAGETNGSAPMLRTIANTSIVSQTIDFLLAASSMGNILLVKQILQRQLPDVLVRYGSTNGALNTHLLKEIIYHELGHTQHYNQVGNNYWTDYITYVVSHGGYGNKSDNGSGRIAISEGWGYYMERVDLINKYAGSSAQVWRNSALTELEAQIPDSRYSYSVSRGINSRGWIATGIYHDMTDNTVEPASTGVTDNVTAFTTASIYRSLQADIVSVRGFQARIQAQSGGLQAAQMEQLVTSYQW